MCCKGKIHFQHLSISLLIMSTVILDNCAITDLGGKCIRICPIRLAQKNERFNEERLEKITFGSRKIDQSVISQLSCGTVQFEYLRRGRIVRSAS